MFDVVIIEYFFCKQCVVYCVVAALRSSAFLMLALFFILQLSRASLDIEKIYLCKMPNLVKYSNLSILFGLIIHSLYFCSVIIA